MRGMNFTTRRRFLFCFLDSISGDPTFISTYIYTVITGYVLRVNSINNNVSVSISWFLIPPITFTIKTYQVFNITSTWYIYLSSFIPGSRYDVQQ